MIAECNIFHVITKEGINKNVTNVEDLEDILGKRRLFFYYRQYIVTFIFTFLIVQ